mmetsp:Transcript_11495/g.23252  ORF Transcript_11495/g.23252 Transcript_11495/m.23252 type:complete len:118 (-) Transcript_11495:327-680(-)
MYPRHGGHAQLQDRREAPNPQQQSSTGTVPKTKLLSKTLIGMHCRPRIDTMVHGTGVKATSFPPTLTTKTSDSAMLSRRNLSCGKSLKVRWLTVVASTAVLMAARLTGGLQPRSSLM